MIYMKEIQNFPEEIRAKLLCIFVNVKGKEDSTNLVKPDHADESILNQKAKVVLKELPWNL